MKARTTVVRALRVFFEEHNFTEVIPTLFSQTIPTEPTIVPFKSNSFLLSTSPEAYLKKAIAGGVGNCFAISSAFRDMEGTSRWHQPEFLMAEWYQRDTTWSDQISMTELLVKSIIKQTDIPFTLPPTPWTRLSWIDLWKTHVGVSFEDVLEDSSMITLASRRGYSVINSTWEQLFNQISLNLIEPHFPKEPFFLIDFPSRISPFSKPHTDKPHIAERFELLINRVELANGNTEYFDELVIRQAMLLEIFNHQPLMHLDESFLESLNQLKNQQWAGVGFGVDRFTALVTDSSVEEIQKP